MCIDTPRPYRSLLLNCHVTDCLSLQLLPLDLVMPPNTQRMCFLHMPSSTTTSLASKCEPKVVFKGASTCLPAPPLPSLPSYLFMLYQRFSAVSLWPVTPSPSHGRCLPFDTTCIITSGVPGDPFVICHPHLCDPPPLPLC